jgi:SAM-dependent methyltransferase
MTMERLYPNTTYEYQNRIGSTLTFGEAVALLRQRITNQIHVGPIVSDVPDWTGHMLREFQEHGFFVDEIYVHPEDFNRYFYSADYSNRFIEYYPSNIHEKSLEHFLGYKLLDIYPDDLMLDVASEDSPIGEIYSRLTGCAYYRQDIMYEIGIHGNMIGSDVSSIPLPDGSISKAIATCSIEHFENESDIYFMSEMQRLLRPGGKLIILPLYMATKPSILSDPLYALSGNVAYDREAEIYFLEGWGNRHARFYTPQTLRERLVEGNQKMRFKVFILRNRNEIHESIYCTFILQGEKLP